MKKKELIVLSILSIVIGGMYLSCMPFALVEMNLADITEGIIPATLNMLLCILITFLTLKIFRVKYPLGFTKDRLAHGLIKSLPVAAAMLVFFATAIAITVYPLNSTPSFLRIVVEGIIYNFTVGFMEELLLRGLVLNAFEGILAKSKHKTAFAIMISSVFFAAGHIPSVIGQGTGMIMFRFFYPLALGIYFGYLYKKYNNIWVPIIIHAALDFAGIMVMLFSLNTTDVLRPMSYVIVSVFSVFLLVYGVVKTAKLDRTEAGSLSW
ncbi:MAG: CPBP family intramembrane metalloprotease [Oscillospiraceae bacterium]|nr:CPBP family intramembrane metalloprotease [Oscillospiraceae bacterium]